MCDRAKINELQTIVTKLAEALIEHIDDDCCRGSTQKAEYVISALQDRWDGRYPYPAVYPSDIVDSHGDVFIYDNDSRVYRCAQESMSRQWHELSFPVARHSQRYAIVDYP